MNMILNIFWVFRTAKYVLFWLYLWQLKEYHIPRFIDHFRTYKGKKLFLNLNYAIKIILLLLFIFTNRFFSVWFLLLLLIYVLESLVFARQILNKSFKKPKFTTKILFLTSISFAVVFAFLFLDFKVLYFLTFDILTPIIISAIVLLIQPFFVLARNNILKKAKNKIVEFQNLKVIGITGSYGKTSTKEFLTTILKE
jgi:UDP-N-acetylmuramoyl-tripeptide--D-alanyl-D-alanine ligase